MDKIKAKKGVFNPLNTWCVLVLVFSVLACTSDPPPKRKISSAKPSFKLVKTPIADPDSVFEFVRKQVDFGPRVPNSTAHKLCGDWLVKKLKSYDFEVIEQRGTQIAHDQKKLFYRNVIGRFGLEKEKRILLTAHWDTRPWADQDVERSDEPIDGANDAGSGVAVILEVARLLKTQMPAIGLDVVLFDIEDYGQSNESFCYGSQIWSKDTRLKGPQPKYGINLDMVGVANAVFMYEGYSQDYARPVLDRVWNIAKNMGYGRYFTSIQDGMITDDHYYVNQAGIPCINIIHREPSTGSFVHTWHTHNDNLDNISPTTLKVVTEVILQTIYREK